MLRISEWLETGDIAPDWPLTDSQGHSTLLSNDAVAGHTLVLLFLPTGSLIDVEALHSLALHKEQLAARGAIPFVIVAATARKIAHDLSPWPVLTDAERRLWRSFGKNHEKPLLIVLRRNFHVGGVYPCSDGGTELMLRRVTALEQEAACATTTSQPPVLRIPEFFSKAECRALIDTYETKGQQCIPTQEAFDYFGEDYKMRIPEHMREDRVDHFFFDKEVVAFLTHRLNRVIPDIQRAFQYRITKYQTLRVARYKGARGGYGHGHRDNIPPFGYRRFAMSVNLNTDEFEGGELCFPEFGNSLHLPASGEAFIFSSSLLHEARQVTKGTRYVFLAFLFGDS